MGIALILGLVFGAAGSMPIAGPLAAVTLKLAIDRRFSVARTATAGASLAEGSYAGVAYWGVTGLVTTAAWLAPVGRGVAGVLLLLFGLYFMRRGAHMTAHPEDGPRRGGEGRGFLLGLTISGSNPALIASWSAVVAFTKGTGLLTLEQRFAPAFGLGAALGVVGWYWTVIALAERYRDRVVAGTLDRLVRGTGALLTAVGAVVLVQLLLPG